MQITIDDAELILYSFRYCDNEGVLSGYDAELCIKIFDAFPELAEDHPSFYSEVRCK